MRAVTVTVTVTGRQADTPREAETVGRTAGAVGRAEVAGSVMAVVNCPPLGNERVVGSTTGAEGSVALVGSGTARLVVKMLPPGRVN